MKPTFYETVLGIVKSTPNNMSLGDSIRSLVNKIESVVEKKTLNDDKQITIFDDLSNYGNRS
jgi:hypothetical protein|tara:strand:+ start:3472 stop:3657 length:186 start_codon:yes stop_codon:yes gene_type:complete